MRSREHFGQLAVATRLARVGYFPLYAYSRYPNGSWPTWPSRPRSSAFPRLGAIRRGQERDARAHGLPPTMRISWKHCGSVTNLAARELLGDLLMELGGQPLSAAPDSLSTPRNQPLPRPLGAGPRRAAAGIRPGEGHFEMRVVCFA